jgi:hypothetical protein
MKISRKTKSAIQKYGIEKCREAYNKHETGYGAKTIGWEMGYSTRQIDSMINAFREIEDWCEDV